MKEIFGSIWVYFLVQDHFICLTTNGTVKKNGEAVMGRGNAKQATILVPGIAKNLAEYLEANGNHAGHFHEATAGLIVFPVKHNWWENADLGLIAESTAWLKLEAKCNPDRTYHLPRPGCGNGKLDWAIVKPLLVDLPDNVWVHDLPLGAKP